MSSPTVAPTALPQAGQSSAEALQPVSICNVHPIAKSRLDTVDFDQLTFGTVFADHMLVVDYADGQWQIPDIVPFDQITMSPSMSAIHYGQSIFEGMKAYRNAQGEVVLFRPEDHLLRLNRSAERLCMPTVPQDLFIRGLSQLIDLDRDWVPSQEGASLYIRPIYFGTDDYIGVHPSENNRLVIFTCPVRAFYKGPVKAMVTKDFARSAEGGVGYVKTSGNYASALYAGKRAKQQGCDVVMWLDAVNHAYVEEFSTMNAFFVINDTVITPNLTNRILSGITRSSILTLLRDNGYKVEERPVSIDEIASAAEAGELKEAFGSGTAAVISPISEFRFENDYRPGFSLPDHAGWKVAPKILQLLSDLRKGLIADQHDWLVAV